MKHAPTKHRAKGFVKAFVFDEGVDLLAAFRHVVLIELDVVRCSRQRRRGDTAALVESVDPGGAQAHHQILCEQNVREIEKRFPADRARVKLSMSATTAKEGSRETDVPNSRVTLLMSFSAHLSCPNSSSHLFRKYSPRRARPRFFRSRLGESHVDRRVPEHVVHAREVAPDSRGAIRN